MPRNTVELLLQFFSHAYANSNELEKSESEQFGNNVRNRTTSSCSFTTYESESIIHYAYDADESRRDKTCDTRYPNSLHEGVFVYTLNVVIFWSLVKNLEE